MKRDPLPKPNFKRTNLDWAELARKARECPGRPLSNAELVRSGQKPLGGRS